MWYARNDPSSPEHQGRPENNRKHGRVRCQGVYCSFGEILDLSASGMRVLSSVRPPPTDRAVVVTVQTLDGPVAVEARVIWSRKTSFFKREIGMKFVDLMPAAAAALSHLGSSVAYNESVRMDIANYRKTP